MLAGQLELINQAAARPNVDVAKLKAQCFDLVADAIAAQAETLAGDPGAQANARRLISSLESHRQALVDVRLHLIELSEDWQCSVCGQDVARAAALSRVSPLEAQLVCKACGAKTALTPEGQRKLQKLFGAVAAGAAWNPAMNGFAP